MSTTHGLGRLYKEDPRDLKYTLRKLLPKKTEVTQKYWPADTWLDQNGFPYCVGYGWAHWVDDGPVYHPTLIDPVWIYNEAQKIDGIPYPHEGSTVRAGAKVLQKQGIISNYYWASTINDIVMTLLTLGPVTVGTDWYSDMSTPNTNFVIKPTGTIQGGHCYVLDGIDTNSGYIRMKNSWGRSWGDKGFASIAISDVDKLFKANGEVCLATEVGGPFIPVPTPKRCWF